MHDNRQSTKRGIVRGICVLAGVGAALVVPAAPEARAGGPVPEDCKLTPPNGCGPADSFISDKWIRDNWGKVHFGGPCTNHDNCYNDPSKTQQQCDDAFYQDMVAECDRVVQWYEYPACISAAGTYYAAVHLVAGPISFDSSHQCALKHQAHDTYCAAHPSDCGASSSASSSPAPILTMSASVTPSGPFTPGQPATFKVTVTDAQNANITNATVAVEDGSDTWVGNGNHTMTPLLRAIPFGNGYTIFRAPLLRVTAPGHAPTSVSLNVTIPKLNVTRTPDTGLTSCAASAITITAKDAATGANVSGTVLVNGAPAGSTGTPITIRPTGLSANVSTPGRVGVSGTTSLTNCEAPEIWLRAAGYPDTLVYRPVRIQGTQVITRSMTIGEVRVPITTAVRTNVQQVQQIQQGPSQLNGGAAVH